MSRGTPVRSKSLNGLVSVGAYYVLFAIAITALWSLSQRQQPTPESPGALAQQDSGHRIIFTQVRRTNFRR